MRIRPSSLLHLQKRLAQLLTKGAHHITIPQDHALSLAILKVVTFNALDMKSTMFFRLVLTQLLTELPEEKGVCVCACVFVGTYTLLPRSGCACASPGKDGEMCMLGCAL